MLQNMFSLNHSDDTASMFKYIAEHVQPQNTFIESNNMLENMFSRNHADAAANMSKYITAHFQSQNVYFYN